MRGLSVEDRRRLMWRIFAGIKAENMLLDKRQPPKRETQQRWLLQSHPRHSAKVQSWVLWLCWYGSVYQIL